MRGVKKIIIIKVKNSKDTQGAVLLIIVICFIFSLQTIDKNRKERVESESDDDVSEEEEDGNDEVKLNLKYLQKKKLRV